MSLNSLLKAQYDLFDGSFRILFSNEIKGTKKSIFLVNLAVLFLSYLFLFVNQALFNLAKQIKRNIFQLKNHSIQSDNTL